MPRASDSKEKTVAAAARLFRRHGYHGAPLLDILAAGGAPRGSLYFHFPSGKEEIGVAALTASGEGIAAGIAASARRAANLAEFLKLTFDGMAGNLRRSGFQDGCPIATVALETAGQSEALRKAANRAFQSWEKELAKGLARFGFKPKQAKGAATVILAQLEGALLLARTSKSLQPLRRAEQALKAMMLRPAINVRFRL
jgi:TetR/AcrR family transcriptional regulator, lmrAB and yxaGH operons repressor